MSYGAISLNAQTRLQAVSRIGTFMERGRRASRIAVSIQKNMIVQLASGLFGVDINYLERVSYRNQIGQVQPGLGGHPGVRIC